MIWYITNVDTEVLALRTALESLPADFPPVRAAQPWTIAIERDLDGASCVLVRLLRRAARLGARASTTFDGGASSAASRSSPSPAKRCPTPS